MLDEALKDRTSVFLNKTTSKSKKPKTKDQYFGKQQLSSYDEPGTANTSFEGAN
jgi:hypothetical protein